MAAMLPDGRRIGVHLAIADGMVKAAERAIEIGVTAAQVFSDNPAAYRRRATPSPELPAFRARLSAAGIDPLVVHGSYLINPAAPDDVLHERSVELLTSELVAARRSGARFVNIHIGSHRGAGIDVGIRRLVEAVSRSLAAADDLGGDELGDPRLDQSPAGQPTIALENGSGGGWGLGINIDELVAIADALDRADVARERVGFCLDTAHAWGAGIDMSDPDVIDALLLDIERRLGLDRLPLIHLNDSRSERGSRLDRHEHVGAGRIGERGIGHLLRHPLLTRAAYILETPGMDVGYDLINLERARTLAAGRSPDPLPPEAFTLKGSRAKAATPPDESRRRDRPPEAAGPESPSTGRAAGSRVPDRAGRRGARTVDRSPKQ
jgi:deoxyribonuclease IV